MNEIQKAISSIGLGGCVNRDTVKSMVLNKINEHKRALERLQSLYDILPDSGEEEEKLYQVISRLDWQRIGSQW